MGTGSDTKNIKKERVQAINDGRVETKFSSTKGEAELNELIDLVDRLEKDYTLFFNGVSNIDPGDKRIRANKLIGLLHSMHLRNPAIRFKFQSIMGRYVSLKNHWDRILNEIDRGTYQRDIFKANMRQRQREEVKQRETQRQARQKGLPDGDNAGDNGDDTQPNAARQWQHADAPGAAPATSASDWHITRTTPAPPARKSVDDIFEEIGNARRQMNLPPLSRDAVARTIDESRTRIMEKYRCKDVDFKVEIVDDKVRLKPIAIMEKE